MDASDPSDANDPSDHDDPNDAALIGRTVAGKFRIDAFLGGGAMGAVYRARQVALEKDVAIKLLRSQYAGDPTFVARFEREAKAASRLDHPNSIRVLDFGRDTDGLLYIAMEYVDGRDLYQVLRDEWPIAATRIVSVMSQALAALAVAHEMGIVHRDLKPENIMLLRGTDDEGRPTDVVKVCDFGIAKLTDKRDTQGGKKLTSQGFVVGTPEYMSPEQGRGEELDLRSDLYSMGVILYQMLTGRVPFEADTALAVVLKQVTEEPPPPRSVNPGANPRLEAACIRAMRKKREERFASARDMRSEIRALLALEALATTQDAQRTAHAPTALAFDSAPVQAALQIATPKATAPGTVAAAPPAKTSRSRSSLFVMGGALAMAGLAAVGWELRGHGSPASETAAMIAPEVAAAPAKDALHAALPPMTPAPLEPMNVTPPAIPVRLTLPSPVVPTPRTSQAPTRTTPQAQSPVSPALPSSPSPAPPPEVVAATPQAPEPAPPQPQAAAPAPAPPPPPPPYDASRARVDWSVASAGGGATASAVQRALARRAGAWTQCYRTALQGRTSPVEGQATLHLSTDEAGNVVSASVRGLDGLPGVKGCVSAAARVRVEGVDTGDAWADVQLTFSGGA